jgi:hypothetical protein
MGRKKSPLRVEGESETELVTAREWQQNGNGNGSGVEGGFKSTSWKSPRYVWYRARIKTR